MMRKTDEKARRNIAGLPEEEGLVYEGKGAKSGRTAKIAAALLAAAMMAAGCAPAASDDNGKKDENAQDQSARSSKKEKEDGQEDGAQDDEGSKEQDDDIEFEGVSMAPGKIDVTSLDDNLILAKAGTYTISGKTEHAIVVDAGSDDEVTIVLDALKSTTKETPAIYVRNAKSVRLTLQGISEFSTTGSDALNASIYSKDDLIIDGTGSLTITETLGHGIKAKDNLTIDQANLDIHARKDGIHVNDDADIQGTLRIVSDEDEGIQSELSLLLKGGTYNIESAGDCLRAEQTLIVESGTYTLVSTQNEGIESKDKLQIQDGTFDITAYDDGLNAANSLVIDGGVLNVYSQSNDGIDSNGDLIINGGTICSEAMTTPEGPFDTDGTPFEIHGGTVFGLGAQLCLPTDASGVQIAFSLPQDGAKTIEIVQDGEVLFKRDLTSETKDNAVSQNADDQNRQGRGPGGQSSQASGYFASDKLKEGSKIEIQVDGEVVYSETLQSGLNSFGSVSVFDSFPNGGRGFEGQERPPFMDEEGSFNDGMQPPQQDGNEGGRPSKGFGQNGRSPQRQESGNE